MRPKRRATAWGAAAAILYVITAVASSRWSGLPARILYDGLAPLTPYRWVHPPPELARDNQPPEPGTGDIPFGPEGLSPLSVTTGDGQAAVIFSEKTVARRAGEAAVRVTLVPLDPAARAAAPPGLRFDSNAYQIEVSYIPSGALVRLSARATVVLRYATGATGIMHFSGMAWTPLETKRYDAPQLATADTQALGIFAAAAPATLPYTAPSHWLRYGVLVSLTLVAFLALYLLPRLARRGRVPLRRSS